MCVCVCEAGEREEREREGIERVHVSKEDIEVKGGTCTYSKKMCV